jgi:hypothetical protein
MGKIISFSGRMKSGKTELAKICEQYGYERLYFAMPLKQLCADLLDISIEELNKAKVEKTDIGITIDKALCEMISEETEIPLETVMETCDGVTIKDVRHMLQFIGTDLIRSYNKDWHVDRIRAMVDKDKNYVFDDVRFPNELKLIEELGGDCWFIIRPTLENISNHESETSITWNNCWNKLIINDSTLHSLLFKWETFIGNYDQSCAIRNKEFKRILEDGSKDDITPLSMYDMMLLSKHMFDYVPRTFEKDKIKKISMNEDKSVFITYIDDSMELIDNALIIEELKLLL